MRNIETKHPIYYAESACTEQLSNGIVSEKLFRLIE